MNQPRSELEIERLLSPKVQETEAPTLDLALRPQSFAAYPGQDKAKENLKVYVKAALIRGEPMDHCLLHGPPGLGKTTLARILAMELGVPFYQATGPALDKTGDLAGILAGVESRGLLFIDEIHRLPIAVEEVLYSAMEDFAMEIVVGQGTAARTVKMPINPFTLVGATTRLSLISGPMLSRFGIQERLEFYSIEALVEVILRSAKLLGFPLSAPSARELALRSRGTPRVANRLLRRVRDFASFAGESEAELELVNLALSKLSIDALGLDSSDRRILWTMRERYDGGPVGLDTLAATLGENRHTLEEVYEPYLLHMGLISRGPRGRELSALGLKHLEEQKSLIEMDFH